MCPAKQRSTPTQPDSCAQLKKPTPGTARPSTTDHNNDIPTQPDSCTSLSSSGLHNYINMQRLAASSTMVQLCSLKTLIGPRPSEVADWPSAQQISKFPNPFTHTQGDERKTVAQLSVSAHFPSRLFSFFIHTLLFVIHFVLFEWTPSTPLFCILCSQPPSSGSHSPPLSTPLPGRLGPTYRVKATSLAAHARPY